MTIMVSENVDATVGVLGTGAVGSRVATVLLAHDRRVTVWNRTAARTQSLVREGATAASTAADAAAAGQLVIACLTDYAAVRAVLDATADVLGGKTFLALTTGSPEEARTAAALAAESGATYLDGGLQSAPDAIGSDATIFYSGPVDVFTRHRDTLALLGPARHVGTDPGAAAVQDLALFGLWYDAQLAYLRTLETVRGAGIDVADFAPLAATQLGHVVAGAADTAREITAGNYPRGPADLTEHEPVLEKLVALRAGQRLGDGQLDLALRLVREHIAHGRGDEGLNAIFP
jgi:3-hydroxyisobutyrate dehydrogenase-like beta-hydroxyacid dehydrogenase